MAWTDPAGHIWAVGEILTAANMNTYVEANLAFLYGDAAWTAVTLVNSWTNVGAFGSASCRLFGIWVVLRGLVTGGTAGPICTLPVGYRPPVELRFAIDGSGSFQELDIATTGVVQVQTAGRTNISISGIQFSTI